MALARVQACEAHRLVGKLLPLVLGVPVKQLDLEVAAHQHVLAHAVQIHLLFRSRQVPVVPLSPPCAPAPCTCNFLRLWAAIYLLQLVCPGADSHDRVEVGSPCDRDVGESDVCNPELRVFQPLIERRVKVLHVSHLADASDSLRLGLAIEPAVCPPLRKEVDGSLRRADRLLVSDALGEQVGRNHEPRPALASFAVHGNDVVGVQQQPPLHLVAERLDLAQRGRVVVEERDPHDRAVELGWEIRLFGAQVEHFVLARVLLIEKLLHKAEVIADSN
mmetsp:Transcript_7113/g.14161  ORF Transcript_7113/g.14161 Transcript_7113/m.14161 type:complete len:276 (-) Transcript_7113:204-1031(-)